MRPTIRMLVALAAITSLNSPAADAGWRFPWCKDKDCCCSRDKTRSCEKDEDDRKYFLGDRPQTGTIHRSVGVRVTNDQALRVNREDLNQRVRIQTRASGPSEFDTPSAQNRMDQVEKTLHDIADQLNEVASQLQNFRTELDQLKSQKNGKSK